MPSEYRDRERSRSPARSHRRRSREPEDDYEDKERRRHHRKEREGDSSSRHHRHSRSSRHHYEREDRRSASRDYEDAEEEDRRKSRKRKEERSSKKRSRRDDRDDGSGDERKKRASELQKSYYEATLAGVGTSEGADTGADKFVWKKKQDKERKSGISEEEARRRDMDRARESAIELEKLNQRREQRERELKEREEESLRAARMADSAQMAAYIEKEDQFQLEQAKRRAAIRIRERRAKPIDFLALNLKWSRPQDEIEQDDDEEDEGVGLEVDIEEPYAIFDNLTLEDSEELHQDIKMYLTLEKSEVNLEFWRCLLIVSAATLEERRQERAIGRSAYAEQQRATAAVRAQVQQLLAGKSYEQLIALQGQIQRKLASNEPIDVEYWEGLLKELVVWKAKAKLRDMHEIVLNNRLEQLRRKQRDEAVRQKEQIMQVQSNAQEGGEEEDDSMPARPTFELVFDQWDEALEPPRLKRILEEYQNCEVVDADEDLQRLYARRRAVAKTRFVAKPEARQVNQPNQVEIAKSHTDKLKDEEIYQAAIGEGFDEEEELFNVEAITGRSSYAWEDKYRPRKPRYFNKVHTGYEWNKYNQTHYDIDNPPPKVVQGYKFNIFYPDLIDKTKTPTFKIIKQPEQPDTCILLFQAGPPYEDLAFTIVNKEWEYSHKKGFKSVFDRGVLQLYFTFKRTFYRK